jgi:hypothetical protein
VPEPSISATRGAISRRLMPEISVLLADHDAVYVEIPKVACSSIKLALAGLLGIDLEPVHGNPHEARFPAPPSPSTSGPLWPDLFSFAFVRNPWDRLVSCYRDKIIGEAPDYTSFDPERGVARCLARFDAFKPGMSFDDFVEVVAGIPDEEADEHVRAQWTFIADRDGDIAVSFVGRFENLAHDFRLACARAGLPDLDLPRAQACCSPARYSRYYSSTTRDLVAERFQKDVELFGYEFDDSR